VTGKPPDVAMVINTLYTIKSC